MKNFKKYKKKKIFFSFFFENFFFHFFFILGQFTMYKSNKIFKTGPFLKSLKHQTVKKLKKYKKFHDYIQKKVCHMHALRTPRNIKGPLCS